MKQITLELLTSPACHICEAFKEFWHSISKDWPNVSFKEVSVITPEGQEFAQKHMIFASPGIIINGELWASGGFDRDQLVERLKELSNEFLAKNSA